MLDASNYWARCRVADDLRRAFLLWLEDVQTPEARLLDQLEDFFSKLKGDARISTWGARSSPRRILSDDRSEHSSTASSCCSGEEAPAVLTASEDVAKVLEDGRPDEVDKQAVAKLVDYFESVEAEAAANVLKSLDKTA